MDREQRRRLLLRVKDVERRRLLRSVDEAITLLYVHGYILLGQRDKARKKLVKEIEDALNPNIFDPNIIKYRKED